MKYMIAFFVCALLFLSAAFLAITEVGRRFHAPLTYVIHNGYGVTLAAINDWLADRGHRMAQEDDPRSLIEEGREGPWLAVRGNIRLIETMPNDQGFAHTMLVIDHAFDFDIEPDTQIMTDTGSSLSARDLRRMDYVEIYGKPNSFTTNTSCDPKWVMVARRVIVLNRSGDHRPYHEYHKEYGKIVRQGVVRLASGYEAELSSHSRCVNGQGTAIDCQRLQPSPQAVEVIEQMADPRYLEALRNSDVCDPETTSFRREVILLITER